MRRVPLLLASLLFVPIALAGNPPDPVETDVISTGRAPCGTARALGAVWVGVYETGRLLQLDPESGHITRRFVVGKWACRIAVVKDAAWVTRDRAGVVVRVDLKTGARQAFQVGASPFDVVSAFGSVWVTSFDIRTVARIDPRTRRLTRVYKLPANPAGITACAGRIWVGHGRAGTHVTSIDPSTHRIRRVATGTRAPGWPRCIRGEVWVTAPESLLRIDARTGKTLRRLHVGGTLAEAAGGPDGLVWVTDKERSLVHRVEPGGSAVVDSFAAGPGAYSLVRAGAGMWVTSFAGADVRHYDP